MCIRDSPYVDESNVSRKSNFSLATLTEVPISTFNREHAYAFDCVIKTRHKSMIKFLIKYLLIYCSKYLITSEIRI